MKAWVRRTAVIISCCLGFPPELFGSVLESFITAGDVSETLCSYTTESPRQMAATPGGSGLTWGGYSQASVNNWTANIGVQGSNKRFIIYAVSNQHQKSGNFNGTYIYTIFNTSGGITPEVAVNLDQIQAYIDAAAPGQQLRWLLRDGSGQWFISGITVIATTDIWYGISPETMSWLRVNTAAETDMNQMDADAKTPISDPATLASQTPDFTQITGGGIYIEQGAVGSDSSAFILNDINWISEPEPTDLYISTDGNDANSGTEASPFATLEGARDAIRAGGLSANGVNVYLRGGSYRLNSTFSLTSQDSGVEGHPIVYRAYPGEEVILHGADVLSSGDFVPVTDPAVLARLPQSAADRVLECDLAALGITDYGQLTQASDHDVSPAELYFNERPMTLAQWPNEGFTLSGDKIRIGTTDPLVGSIFEYTDERIETWSSYADVWVGGNWAVETFDSMEILSVDTGANTIETVQPPITWGSPRLESNRRMFYFNVLDELDLPTEYYIDRTAGKLYFYPPDFMDGSNIQLSMLADELINLNQTSHIQFKNLIFEAARHRAIGTSRASNIEVYGCTFRNLGKNAVTCWLGENIRIDSCDFYETGDGGIRTFGGDRETLTPGNHEVENCHFYNSARLTKTEAWPVRMERVGHKARHCLNHGNWRGGFSFPGNDHLYEYNEINNIMKNSNDTSGIGSGFDWTGSGTHIRYNFIHNYHGVPSHSIIAVGVYVDDGLSGNHVYQNVFYDIDQAFFSHGGRATVVDNNLMIDCDRSMVFMDPSLVTWWGSRFTTLTQKMNDLYNLDAPTVEALYESRYPHLINIQADLAAHAADPENIEYQYPKDNVGTKNLLYNSGAPEIPVNALTYGTFSNNYEMAAGEDAGFIDPDTLNFGLETNSPLFSLIPGFQDIPFDQIGLYTNEYRAVFPSLGDFKLFLPADAAPIDGNPVEFAWESCPFADEYLLEIATDPDFAGVVFATNKEDMCYSFVSVTVAGLSASQPYYWRVKASTNSRSMNLAEKNQAGPAYYILNGTRYPDFRLTAETPASFGLEMENLSPFAGYQVEQSTNLLSAWKPLTNFIAPLAGQFSVGSISNNPPAMFFRLTK